MGKLLDILKAAILFCVYALGLKRGKEEQVMLETKEALKEANRALEGREAIRVKTRQLKETIPDSWDDDGRVSNTGTGKRP